MRIVYERERDGRLIIVADEVGRSELWPEREGWAPYYINRQKNMAQFIYKPAEKRVKP